MTGPSKKKQTAEDLQRREATYEFSEGTRKQVVNAINGMLRKERGHLTTLFGRSYIQTSRPIMHYVISRAAMDEILLELDKGEADTRAIRHNLRGPGYHKKHPYNMIESTRLVDIAKDETGSWCHPGNVCCGRECTRCPRTTTGGGTE